MYPFLHPHLCNSQAYGVSISMGETENIYKERVSWAPQCWHNLLGKTGFTGKREKKKKTDGGDVKKKTDRNVLLLDFCTG